MSYSPCSKGPTSGVPLTTTLVWAPPPLLAELASDDAQFIAEIVDAFTAHTKSRMERIRGGLAEGDFSKVRDEAHGIKGSARQLGLDRLAEAGQDLENAASGEDSQLSAERLDRVQAAFDEAGRSLAAYVTGLDERIGQGAGRP